MPTELELKNADTVLGMLNEIEDIGFERVRGDIFKVTEFESRMDLSITVDVEETTVVLLMDVCDIPQYSGPASFMYETMLRLNAKSVHGAFGVIENRVIVKDVLEVENLNKNELEASLGHMFALVANNIESIVNAKVEKETK